MRNLYVSPAVQTKLKEKHNVAVSEVIECFGNRIGHFLEDIREEHKTNPKTQWFVAETNHGRKLKVVFIQFTDGSIRLRTAYQANKTEIGLYNNLACK